MNSAEKTVVADVIIQKHLCALVKELYESGIEALGIAGGIILHDDDVTLESGSPCHVFHLIQEGVESLSGGVLTEEEASARFVTDVAETMRRGLVEDASLKPVRLYHSKEPS